MDSQQANVPLAQKRIRIRPELRATQVEEAYEMVPAITLYFTEKYDLGATNLNNSFQKVSLLQALKFLIKSEAEILEVPEPLWVRFLPKNLVLLGVWKLSGRLKGRSHLAVTYAIENNDLWRLLSPGKVLPKLVMRVAGAVLGSIMARLIDRIAFGSAGSQAVYHSIPCISRIPNRLFEELPAEAAGILPSTYHRVVFIGELDDRKGILDLMEAWPLVETSVPEAILTIIGAGPHSEQVVGWCTERPARRLFTGFLSHQEVKKSLQQGGVLVAPSRRTGRWREQIGLPIAEALSHGLTVVTTDETGLATWLAANGHFVVREPLSANELSDALISALENPLQPSDVIKSLPSTPGRIEADRWLHA